MVKMDLKLKGITWVRNFSQKFEEVCQEVDGTVGQGAVKYLGNQVQNVGDSVKRFYSGVVQEVLPLPSLVSSVKHGSGSVASNNNVDSSLKLKRFYSGVVQEALPLPSLVSSVEHGSVSVALNNDVDSPLKSITAVKENKKGTEENPVNSVIKSLHDFDPTNSATNQHAQTSIKPDLVNQISDEISSNSLEVEESYTTREEVGDDYSRETSDVVKESLHVSVEQNAVKSIPQLLDLMSVSEKETLESSISSESLSDSYDSENGAQTGIDKISDVTLVQNSCPVVEENAMKSSTSQLLKFMSLGEKESIDASVSEPLDGGDERSRGVLSDASPVTSISNMNSQSSPKAGTDICNIEARDQCLYGSESSDSLASSEVAYSTVSSERPMTNVEPLSFKSSFMSESDSPSAKSPGSYCFQFDSCKDNSVDVAGSILDSSMVLVSCTTTPDVAGAGQFVTSEAGLASSGSSQSMESNEGENSGVNEVMPSDNLFGIKHGQISSAHDRGSMSLSEMDNSLINSIESSKRDIQLSDNTKLEESCVFVDDIELHAVSNRAQRHRSYKRRIKDAFAPKRRIEKEYEQLSIWYGDSDMESNEGASQTLLTFSSSRSLDSKNLQVQDLSESEWEIL